MIDIQEKKQETLGLLDAIISLLENLHSVSFNISDTLPSNYGAGVTDNDAFGYLFDVLKSLNGSTQEVLDFVVNILEKAMPVMEIAVKAMLIANIKSEVNCGSDPIIPNKLREFYYNSDYALYRNKHWKTTNTVTSGGTTTVEGLNWTDTKVMQIKKVEFGEGLKVNVGSIDFLDKLKYNPCADGGDLLYFGIMPKQSPYSLCRAIDMDAFFWFTMHKAKFYSAYQTDGLDELKTHFNATSLTKVVDGEQANPKDDYRKVGDEDEDEEDVFSLYDFFFVNNNNDDESLKNVACGTAIKYQGGNMIAICTKVRNCTESNGTTTKTEYAQFMPCSSTYQGAMWYIDSYCYHGKDLLLTSTSDKKVIKHDEIYGGVGTEETDEENEANDEAKLKSYSHPRDYEKEFPIFKLEYDAMTSGIGTIPSKKGYDTTSYNSATSRNTANLTFKILAKPFVLYPQMATNKFQQIFLANKVTFDSVGTRDRKGHFSCYIDPSFVSTYSRTAVSTNLGMPSSTTGTSHTISKSYPVKDVYPTATADTDYVAVGLNTATTPTMTDTTVTANCEQCYYNWDTGEMQDYTKGSDTPDGFKACWRYRVLNGKQFSQIAKRSDVNGGTSSTNDFIGWLIVGRTSKYVLKMKDNHLPQECLYPCYAPTTIYQFNYQYVMGMQLFNAKQILCSALDFTLGLNLNLELGLSEKLGLDKRRLIEIIKSMCDVDSSSISDCFYSFSNSKFEKMLNKSDQLRKGGYQFEGSDNHVQKTDYSTLRSVLNEYDGEATLNKRTDVLKRAITEASVSITETKDTPDTVDISTGLNYEFLKELINNITVSMISSLITPKVIMLFKVNQELMGNYDEYESVEDFLRTNEAIVISLVKKIRDMVLEELLAFVMDKIKIIISLWSTELLREYAEKIARILKLMKEDWLNCIPTWTKQRVLDTEIPIVNYADIDNNTAPVTEHCE